MLSFRKKFSLGCLFQKEHWTLLILHISKLFARLTLLNITNVLSRLKIQYLHFVYTLKWSSWRQAPSEEQDSLHLSLCARILWILQMQKHTDSLKKLNQFISDSCFILVINCFRFHFNVYVISFL